MTDQSFASSLGARTLQEAEVNLSLPTYSKLREQIDTIRKNAVAYQNAGTENRDSRNAFLRPQVINNLSILGHRGSGKSSILKTLYHDLEAEKEKNILLPPIVPENLESHMTLLSSLLGLLNDQVKQLSKKQQSTCPGCPPKRTRWKRNTASWWSAMCIFKSPIRIFPSNSILRNMTMCERCRTYLRLATSSHGSSGILLITC